MPAAPPPTITMVCFTSAEPAAGLCTIASMEASFAICSIFFTCIFSYLTIYKCIMLSTGVKEVSDETYCSHSQARGRTAAETFGFSTVWTVWFYDRGQQPA